MLKVGDKIIEKSMYRAELTEVKVLEIVKINKASYKLSDGTLISLSLFSKRKRETYSMHSEYYYEYSKEKYDELKLELEKAKEKEFVRRLDYILDKYSLEEVKKYVKIKESVNNV